MENNFFEHLIKKVGLPFLVEFTTEKEEKESMSRVMSENENVSFLTVPGREGEKNGSIFVYDKTKTLDPTMKDVVLWTLSEMEKAKQTKLTKKEIQEYCEQLLESKPAETAEIKLAASEILSEVNVNKKKM